MIVSVNQPAYLPWLGYFHRIAISDAHIVLDAVQFEKNGFTNRNKVRTHEGWCWLSVPVKTAGRFQELPISGLEIANEKAWAAKHWATLRFNYSKAPFFDQHARFFETVYARQWHKLSDLAREITEYLLSAFNIGTKLRLSSDMKVFGKKDELVLNLCRQLGATVYLSGQLGKNYLREELFREQGITVRYHNYQHPTYRQVYPGFEPYTAAIDLLFNTGPESREILMKDQERITL
jgi:hypothetical protein